MVKGLCMACRRKDPKNAKKDMKDTKIEMTSRGGFMAKGKCIDCGCGMCAVMSKDNAEKAIKNGEAKKAF